MPPTATISAPPSTISTGCGLLMSSESIGRGSSPPSRMIKFSLYGVAPGFALTLGCDTSKPRVGSTIKTDSSELDFGAGAGMPNRLSSGTLKGTRPDREPVERHVRRLRAIVEGFDGKRERAGDALEVDEERQAGGGGVLHGDHHEGVAAVARVPIGNGKVPVSGGLRDA